MKTFLILITIIIFRVFIKKFINSSYKRKLKRDAKELKNNLQNIYTESHEYIEIIPENFSHLDLSYYDKTSDILKKEGFKFLGNIEDITISKTFLSSKTFVRCLINHDSTICAGIYHFKYIGWRNIFFRILGVKPVKVVDLESEFSNGDFLCTSNSSLASKIKLPEEIKAKFLTNKTPIIEILKIHNKRISEYLKVKPNISSKKINTLSEIYSFQDRMMNLKAKFRSSMSNYITDKEIKNIDGIKHTEAAEILSDEMKNENI